MLLLIEKITDMKKGIQSMFECPFFIKILRLNF